MGSVGRAKRSVTVTAPARLRMEAAAEMTTGDASWILASVLACLRPFCSFSLFELGFNLAQPGLPHGEVAVACWLFLLRVLRAAHTKA